MNTVNGGGQPGPTDSYRIRMVAADHRWSFVFTAADADLMLKRVAELACDPDAPLSPSDARLLGERVAQVRAAAIPTIVAPGVNPPAPTVGPIDVTVRR